MLVGEYFLLYVAVHSVWVDLSLDMVAYPKYCREQEVAPIARSRPMARETLIQGDVLWASRHLH